MIGLFARTESPALGLHHNPDFSFVYRRGMASQAAQDVNLDNGRSSGGHGASAADQICGDNCSTGI
jgi:hypothetical protein